MGNFVPSKFFLYSDESFSLKYSQSEYFTLVNGVVNPLKRERINCTSDPPNTYSKLNSSVSDGGGSSSRRNVSMSRMLIRPSSTSDIPDDDIFVVDSLASIDEEEAAARESWTKDWGVGTPNYELALRFAYQKPPLSRKSTLKTPLSQDFSIKGNDTQEMGTKLPRANRLSDIKKKRSRIRIVFIPQAASLSSTMDEEYEQLCVGQKLKTIKAPSYARPRSRAQDTGDDIKPDMEIVDVEFDDKNGILYSSLVNLAKVTPEEACRNLMRVYHFAHVSDVELPTETGTDQAQDELAIVDITHNIQLRLNSNDNERRFMAFAIELPSATLVCKMNGLILMAKSLNPTKTIADGNFATAFLSKMSVPENIPHLASDGLPLSRRDFFQAGTMNYSTWTIFLSLENPLVDLAADNLIKTYPSHGASVLRLRPVATGWSASTLRDRLLQDVRGFIRIIKAEHPDALVLLGGHGLLAGFVLNYANWRHREETNGYFFLAPDFGRHARGAWRSGALEKLEDVRCIRNVSRWSTSRTRTPTDEAHIVETQAGLFRRFPPEALKALSLDGMEYQNKKVPLACWVGSQDELLDPEALKKSFDSAFDKACVTEIIPGQTHFGLLCLVGQYIGRWENTLLELREQDSLKKEESLLQEVDALTAAIPTLISSNEKEEVKQHDEVKDINLILQNYIRQEVKAAPTKFILAEDEAILEYRVFRSVSARPVAIIIMVESGPKDLLPFLISAKYPFNVYSLVLRGKADAIGTKINIPSKEIIYSDVRALVRCVRIAEPTAPIILAGHGLGASLLINYACWTGREKPDGYALISPLFAGEGSESHLCRASQIQKLVRIETTTTFGRPISAKPGESVKGTDLTPFDRSSSIALWESVSVTGILKKLSSLDCPWGLWAGSEDDFIKSNPLVSAIVNLKTSVVKESEEIAGSSHFGTLITASAFVGPFIANLVNMIQPKTPFIIKSPKLEDFEKVRLLGRGSYGTVFLVRHRLSDKLFAMKQLSKSKIYSAGEAAHVLSERRLLRHTLPECPAAVRYVCSFQDGKLLYIVQEYVPGGELFSLLRAARKLEEGHARFYAAEMIVFLEWMHGRNVVYRDLKPENVLIDDHGHLKFADFGFAKFLGRKRTAAIKRPDVSLNGGQDEPISSRGRAIKRNGHDDEYQTRTFCGTPQYMAPEVLLSLDASNGGYGMSVDWWSLGIVIYEMLIGRNPWDNGRGDHIATFKAILSGDIPFPRNAISPLAKDIILRLLDRNPKTRLGCDGAAEVKAHPWFTSIDWERLQEREVAAPYVPRASVEATVLAGSSEASTEQQNAASGEEVERAFLEF